MSRIVSGILVALGLCVVAAPAAAQWLDYPEAGLPRKNGKLDVDAPTPRLSNGKPDLSGLWKTTDSFKYGTNIAVDLPGSEAPLLPASRALLKQRLDRKGADDPSGFCLPPGPIILYTLPPMRILQLPNRLVMLYEVFTTYRQVFLDGRPFPKDPVPSYNGYSVGHWEGDTLVIESMGFNGKFWLDGDGRPITEQLHLTERIRRPAFGRLEIELTFDDPGAYSKPWTVHETLGYVPDSELFEQYCEDNQYPEQLRRAIEAQPAAPEAASPSKEKKPAKGKK